MTRSLPTMSKDCAARNKAVLAGGAVIASSETGPAKRKLKQVVAEAELQRQCEQFLGLHGFLRLTAENAELATTNASVRGFFGHMQKAQGNPLMPDLVVISSGRPSLFVELKVRPVYQPGQKEMIARGLWLECRSLDEFVSTFLRWLEVCGANGG